LCSRASAGILIDAMAHDRSARSLFAIAVLAAASMGISLPASARPCSRVQNASGGAAASRSRGLSTRDELEAFVDGVMIANLRDKHVAGATLSVVSGGKLFFAKGYGFADVEKKTPVDAEKTLFRIGSVSKLFTWTAVMQLVEAGKLSLDADVNTYLDFQIPRTYPQPITLRHMMTHTAGFEDDGRDLFSEDPARIVPLGSWLAAHVPARVRAPGLFASYSNYAAALAGYVVERASGMAWADFIEQRVLAPLGMRHTSVRQPLPAQLAADMSLGYDFDDGAFTAQKWEVITGAAPAGSMSATATDIATFMLAHLEGGSFERERILDAPTCERMHARAFGHDERINGSALGFYEKSSHDLRIVGHNGDTVWFHSDLALVPSEHLGIFVSYNTSGGNQLSRFTFLTEFLDHYYPPAPMPAVDSRDARTEMERVVGEYAFMRRSYTTYQKVDGLSGAVHVDATETGTLRWSSPLGTCELVRVGPMLYRDALGESLFAFGGEANSPASQAFMGDVPPMALERVRWFESPELHWWLLGWAMLVFALTIASAIRRALRRRFGSVRSDDSLMGRGWLVGAVLCDVAFVLAFLVLVSDPRALVTSPMIALKIALALPVAGVLFAIVAALRGVTQWRSNSGARSARLCYAAVVVTAFAFAWSLNVWNLLGWRM
jgi:CubicO group peptidase (beta-lactamase class C family)/multisubunit Na+/H+ antiporter MnhG subunit